MGVIWEYLGVIEFVGDFGRFSLLQWITVLKGWSGQCRQDGNDCFTIKVRTISTEFTDIRIITGNRTEFLIIGLKKQLITSYFWRMLCFLRSDVITFLEELSVRRFMDIQEEIWSRVVCIWAILESKLWWNENICVFSTRQYLEIVFISAGISSISVHIRTRRSRGLMTTKSLK